jgi:hypothetical protein
MPRRVPCLEKLVSLTGYRPTTPLATIIDQVAAHAADKKQAVPAFPAANRELVPAAAG